MSSMKDFDGVKCMLKISETPIGSRSGPGWKIVSFGNPTRNHGLIAEGVR